MATRDTGNCASITVFLAGDVMTGCGIDQILPHPGVDRLHEDYVHSAVEYVQPGKRAHGRIHGPAAFDYIWSEHRGGCLSHFPSCRPCCHASSSQIAYKGS